MKRKSGAFLGAGLVAALATLVQASCSQRPEGRNVISNPSGGTGTTAGASGASGSSGANGAGGAGAGVGAGGSSGPGGAGGTDPVPENDPTCTAFTPPRAQVLSPQSPDVAPLLAQMNLSQKIAMLSGGPVCPNYDCDFEGTGVPQTNPPVPDFKMRDGPRGVHVLSGGRSSTWAVAVARAAAFDLDLEYRVGKAQGVEMRALKFDLSLSPTINTLRHPQWARAQETYGEDPVLQGEMGAAFVRGMQESVPACPKHLVANDTDNNRNTVMAQMDEQTLRENYMRPFQIVVEKADPACIMAAYNGLNGEWCTENQHILTEIIRTDWGWKGFALSDWWATKEHGAESMMSGLDLEMPDNRAFETLPQDIQSGRVQATRIDEAASRILNARLKFKQLTNEYKSSPENPGIVNDANHKALARETAEKGAVLLKNDQILPLGAKATEIERGKADVRSIIILGPDRDKPTTNVGTANQASGLGDRGSSGTNPPYAISLVQGITERAGSGITVTNSANAADAANADVAIIPVTMAHEDEGEAFDGGRDRENLTLTGPHPRHWGTTKPSAFIAQAAAANPNVIVLLMVGSAIVMEDWMQHAKAIVQTFYPGQEGGNAVAKLLFGDLNFSGKLPFTVAAAPGDYPAFQNNVPRATTDYLHGYRKIEAESKTPRFWFGYGDSYTIYEYSGLKLLCTNGIGAEGRINVEVTVKNAGKMAGDEVVQLYIGYPNTTARRPKKELKAFTRVALAPGESKAVQLFVPVKEIAYWGAQGWTVEKGIEHTVLVGPSADPARLLSANFTIN